MARNWARDVLTIGSWVINHWPTPLLTVGPVYGPTAEAPNRSVCHPCDEEAPVGSESSVQYSKPGTRRIR